MTGIEMGALAGAMATLIGAVGTVRHQSLKHAQAMAKIAQEQDEQDAGQAERVVSILRELLAEERARADKFQQNSERLADELASTKLALSECQSEVKMLRKDLQDLTKKLEEQGKK